MTKELLQILNKRYIGKRIIIHHLDGEDNRYDGIEGVVQYLDDMGQLHGTWCGLAIIPDIDDFEIIGDADEEEL